MPHQIFSCFSFLMRFWIQSRTPVMMATMRNKTINSRVTNVFMYAVKSQQHDLFSGAGDDEPCRTAPPMTSATSGASARRE